MNLTIKNLFLISYIIVSTLGFSPCNYQFIEIKAEDDSIYQKYSYEYEDYKCLDNGFQIIAKAKDPLKFTDFFLIKMFKKGSIPYKSITLSFIFLNNDEVNIQISEFSKDFKSKKRSQFSQSSLNLVKLKYLITINRDPLQIIIYRKSNNQIIFDSSLDALFLSKNYLTISTSIDSKNIFGLGTRFDYFRLSLGRYTIWNKDNPSPVENSKQNTYGSHPIYLNLEQTGLSHIVFLKTVSPLEILYEEFTDIRLLKYKLMKGNIDLYFFLGNDKIENTIKKYHKFLGNGGLFPFWAMGFWQSRFGYKNVKKLEEVIKDYAKHKIPLEGVFLDIDFLSEFKPFIIDKTRYPPSDIIKLKENYEIKIVPIVEPLIASSILTNKNYICDYRVFKKKRIKTLFENNILKCESFNPEKLGLDLDVFLKTNDKNITNYMLVQQWFKGNLLVPDFLHPNITEFWSQILKNLYSEIKYDGIWLDMNEISIFNVPSEILIKEKNKYPFIPFDLHPGPSQKTLDISLKHFDGTLELDFHNLNSYYQIKETYEFLTKKLNKKIPFILTRASVFGAHKMAQTWSGDNRSNQIYLKLSISSLFSLGLYGFAMSGSDVCGFLGDCNKDLCARWMQLSTFYPFARNHNNDMHKSQEPYIYGEKVILAAKKAVEFRYSILKWFYSLFVKNKGVGMVIKALFFEFNDEYCLNDKVLQTEFLVGEEILVIPVLEYYEDFVKGYFPNNTNFYDYFSGKKMMKGINLIHNKKNDYVPTFLREGFLIFYQNSKNIMKVKQLDSTFNIKIAFFNDSINRNLISKGNIIGFDNYDEEKIDSYCVKKDCLLKLFINLKQIHSDLIYISMKFEFSEQFIINKINEKILKPIAISKIKLYGIEKINLDNYIAIIDENFVGNILKKNNFFKLNFKEKIYITKNMLINMKLFIQKN